MLIGWIYFIVIILANSVGAISGMGGGVIIKPIFDLIGAHSVVEISFYSTVAVFTMSLVSTSYRLKNSNNFNWKIICYVSLGSIMGGYTGSIFFDRLIELWDDSIVQLVQIFILILVLLFSLFTSLFSVRTYQLKNFIWYILCGCLLGFIASLLGIGGGPINVSLMMILFSIPIKDAVVYSICTIFFSQGSKIITIMVTTGLSVYDLGILYYVIPAAIIGGILGAKLGKVLSEQKVEIVFRSIIIIDIFINFYNIYKIM